MDVNDIEKENLPDLNKGAGHKYDHGHALILSGGPGQGGAARLAARGALRTGAGLVTLACPLRALLEHSAQLDAVMTRGIDGPSGLGELLEDLRFTSVGLGPGLGLTQITVDLVRVAVSAKRPCVLDADALMRFQRSPDVLFELLHTDVVLTPHAGEFARLFPDLKDPEDKTAKIAATRMAARRSGAIVVYKGIETVIASPDGACAIHRATGPRAAPWLATAGAGDVLTGFITGLMARGIPAMQAAQAAVWLHVECARVFGPGLIAEDLPEVLPGVFRDMFAS